MTTYRLTLADRINQAEPPKVLYLRGATRLEAEHTAKMATGRTERVVDLVQLD